MWAWQDDWGSFSSVFSPNSVQCFYLTKDKEIWESSNRHKNLHSVTLQPKEIHAISLTFQEHPQAPPSCVGCQRTFLLLLLELSLCIAIKTIVVGPEKVQVERLALHTTVEGMQICFLISWLISIFIQSPCIIRSINKSRENNSAFPQSWRFTGNPSHVNL